MLTCKKIYIDTKFKTPDSISNSNFKWELPETLTMPHNTIFYVDDICIPHSWYTIETNVNDRLYIQRTLTTAFVSTHENVCKIVVLSPGHYTLQTLAAEMKLKIDNAYGTPVMNVTPDPITNVLKLIPMSVIYQFKLLTDTDIATGLAGINLNGWNGAWNGSAYDQKHPMDINDILNLSESASTFFSASVSMTTGYIDLQPIKNVYMYSTNLGTFKTIGCLGEVTIIKKIPVTADDNEMIFSNVTTQSDWLDCSRQTLKTLWFELKDARGSNLNLHGSHVSFSISFDIHRGLE